ncbi:MAG: DUF1559 family PulG-like putative transporter [Planctomycetota bacterium]|jgi:hypothetical protein
MSEPADNDQPDSEAEGSPAAPGHSLWDVMRHDDEESTADAPPDSGENVSESADDAARPRGLWSVIEHGDEVDSDGEKASDPPAPESSEPEPSDEDDIEFTTADQTDDDADHADFDDNSQEVSDAQESELAESLSPDAEDELADSENESIENDVSKASPDFPLAVQLDVPATRTARTRSGPAHASLSLILGALAAAMSALCLLPVAAMWMLPTVIGAAALLYGCLAVSGGRRQNSDRQTLSVSVGVLCGLIGIFAGPLWLNEAGDRWRHERTSRAVTDNLQSIGTALNAFHKQQGRFPAGGQFLDSADGLPIGMHGWMTDLLPHLGHEELSTQIDRRRPWSDPANAPALTTRVDAYLTPGTPYALTPTGHAPTHFAGVGGRVETDFGTGDLGIFARNSQVTRDDVIDDLSQTMVAGEIAQSIPAWGEPDNWRSIGPGLNQSPHGFGNAAATGAHFLMADGSVRFLSNRTSPRVLQRLSTRNGSERESR